MTTAGRFIVIQSRNPALQSREACVSLSESLGQFFVSSLKREPALDGERPHEHGLLNNERRGHAAMLRVVRDAASSFAGGCYGTCAEICDVLRDLQ